MDNELILFDRLEAIRTVIAKYGEENFYLSFSGGKDSTVLHHLVDMALPNNKIPRVFGNTGIEFLKIVEFVKKLQQNDERFVIIKPSKSIKKTLEEHGYPFKSKTHSAMVSRYQKNKDIVDKLLSEAEQNESLKNDARFLNSLPNGAKGVFCYINGYVAKDDEVFKKQSQHTCPKKLRYQFETIPLKISDSCCLEMKEKPVRKWAKDNNRKNVILGLMAEEGGRRESVQCVSFKGENISFSPLAKVTKEWEEWFIERERVELCELYYEPYNFRRTGCKGCPFSLSLQKDLDTMRKLMPNEREQCEIIWKPVYEEYRKIGYRLDKEEQIKLL